MAIRSGSGALKYPLTNYAQLNAQQSAASASAGGGASASAYGANRSYAANKMRVFADLFNSQQDRNFSAYQQDLNRGFQDYQGGLQRQQQLELQSRDQKNAAQMQANQFGQQKGLQSSSQAFQGTQAEQDRQFQLERDQSRFQQDQIDQNAIDAGIESGIKSGAYTLNPAQMNELAKLEEGRVNITKTGDPAQQRQFMLEYQARKRGILRMATPNQTPADAFNQGIIHYDSKSGKAYDQPIEGVTTPMRPGKDGIPQRIETEDPAAIKQQRDAAEKDLRELHKEAYDIQKASADQAKPMSFEDALTQARKNRAASGLGVPAAPAAAPPAPTPQPGGGPVAPAPQAGPIPPAPAPQTFNMLPNGARIESANRADIYGTAPPSAPAVPAAPPGRTQPVAGNYSIQDPGAALPGNAARMAAAGPQGPSAYQKPDGTWGGVTFDVADAKSNPNKLPKLGQNDEAAFKALPKGAIFIAPDGQMRMK